MKCLSSAAGWAEPDLNSTHVFLSQGKAFQANALLISVGLAMLSGAACHRKGPPAATRATPERKGSDTLPRRELPPRAPIDLRQVWVDP
jgi:predicted small lipoprotein YifL